MGFWRPAAPPPPGSRTGAEVLATLSEQTLRPVYFLVGDDGWTRSRLVTAIRDLSVDAAWRSMNVETLWADESSEASVADAAMTPPFGAARKFVGVRGVEAWRGGASAAAGESGDDDDEPAAPRKRRSKASKSEVTPMVAAIRGASPECVLLLTSEKKPLDWWAGDALFEAAVAAKGVVLCDAPPGDGLRAWVAQRSRDAGVPMEPAAAAELVERMGADPVGLANEAAKLAVFARGSKAVTLEDVKALTGDVSLPSVFEYLDALFVERSPARALTLLARLLEDWHPLAVHAMLLGQMRKIVAVKGALAAGMGNGQIAGSVRLPFATVERLKVVLQRTSGPRLAVLLRALSSAEQALKRSQDGRAVLETLTLECCR